MRSIEETQSKTFHDHFRKFFNFVFSLIFTEENSRFFHRGNFALEFSLPVSVLSATRVEHFRYFFITLPFFSLRDWGSISKNGVDTGFDSKVWKVIRLRIASFEWKSYKKKVSEIFACRGGWKWRQVIDFKGKLKKLNWKWKFS